MRSHEQKVREFFDTPVNYLHKNFGIRLRKKLVQRLINKELFDNVLDVGCGDGSLSIPFMEQFQKLTLNDLSPEMLKIAAHNLSKTNPQISNKVTVSNESFAKATFSQQFDLIIMIGVLAHVEDLDQAISKLSHLLTPNGCLILQFTEFNHPLIKITRWFQRRSYQVNHLSYQRLLSLVKKDFEIVAHSRYLWPFPGMGLVNDDYLFTMQNFILERPHLSRLGSDVILKLRKRTK